VRGTTTTRLSRRGGGLVLNGTKFYSTGSLYADHIAVIAQRDDSGERVQVVTSATAPGVVRLDDYAGFGQRTSASGTTTFTDVRIDPADVIDAPEDEYRSRKLAFLQLVQLAGLAGIARRAAGGTAEFVRGRRRTFAHGNGDLPREDPLVQQVLGRVDSAAYAARAIVLAAAASLDRATDGPPSLDPSAGSPEVAAEIDAYRAQVTVIDLVLRATSELFDVGGASVVDESLRLDRHWRNARTLAVHNPVVYKQRIVGEYLLGGEVPVFLSSVGVAPSVAAGRAG
jgi:alkylation response protein AidB-like acyl-CoA dehydrogenase